MSKIKVIAINGSPRQNGNTFHALQIMGEQLIAENINFEILQIGNKTISGCLSCGKCFRTGDLKCTIHTDPVNAIMQKLKDADGIILGSPVHYSGIGGTMKSFLDRTFYVAFANGNIFRHKVGAAMVAVRRSGGSATLDSLHHYFTISEMPIVSSNYWNIIHGLMPNECLQDQEGVQIIQTLGKNMAWMLKMIRYTKEIIPPPEQVEKISTNFIR